MKYKIEQIRKGFVLLVVILSALFVGKADAQRVAVKTNLLYAATTVPNLALELRMSDKTSLDLGGGLILWQLSDQLSLKHWLVQPELRYWFCEAFNGHFIGLHAHGAQFNVKGLDLPVGRLKSLKGHRYEGYLYGAGLSYGHQWLLSSRWNLELSLGAGWARTHYRQYNGGPCGAFMGEGVYDYFGITRGTLSLVYFIK